MKCHREATARQPRPEREPARTISGSLTRDEIERGKLLALNVLPDRPVTRGDCIGGPRPCPWVSCRHHLYLDVTEFNAVKINFPDVDPEDLGLLEDTCALDVADRGGLHLEGVGLRLNLTRERVRQLEARGLLQCEMDRDLAEQADRRPAPRRKMTKGAVEVRVKKRRSVRVAVTIKASNAPKDCKEGVR